MTAKVPLKVHLRLRFHNPGKPRTAGLCGRAAGACDCGPLSCAFIERPSPLRKPSCKVRFFAQNRSRKYRQKITATTLSQTASDRVFQLLAQMAHVRVHGRKRVHTRISEKDRTQRLTRRNRGPSLPRPQRGFALPVNSFLFRHAFIYIHFPVLCDPPLSATVVSQTIFHPVFQLLLQTVHVCLYSRKRVHTRLSEKNRTQGHTWRNRGVSDGGGITTLGAFCTFTNIPGPGVRTAYFAVFGSWPGALPKNTESLRSSDALMRVAAPRRRGPAGLRKSCCRCSFSLTCWNGKT